MMALSTLAANTKEPVLFTPEDKNECAIDAVLPAVSNHPYCVPINMTSNVKQHDIKLRPKPRKGVVEEVGLEAVATALNIPPTHNVDFFFVVLEDVFEMPVTPRVMSREGHELRFSANTLTPNDREKLAADPSLNLMVANDPLASRVVQHLLMLPTPSRSYCSALPSSSESALSLTSVPPITPAVAQATPPKARGTMPAQAQRRQFSTAIPRLVSSLKAIFV